MFVDFVAVRTCPRGAVYSSDAVVTVIVRLHSELRNSEALRVMAITLNVCDVEAARAPYVTCGVSV